MHALKLVLLFWLTPLWSLVKPVQRKPFLVWLGYFLLILVSTWPLSVLNSVLVLNSSLGSWSYNHNVTRRLCARVLLSHWVTKSLVEFSLNKMSPYPLHTDWQDRWRIGGGKMPFPSGPSVKKTGKGQPIILYKYLPENNINKGNNSAFQKMAGEDVSLWKEKFDTMSGGQCFYQ